MLTPLQAEMTLKDHGGLRHWSRSASREAGGSCPAGGRGGVPPEAGGAAPPGRRQEMLLVLRQPLPGHRNQRDVSRMVFIPGGPKARAFPPPDWEIVSIDSKDVPLAVSGVEIRPVDVAAVMRLIRASRHHPNPPASCTVQ